MNFQKFQANKIFIFWLFILIFSAPAASQEAPVRGYSVATGNNLYCAGYIQTAPVTTSYEVVGAEDEADQYVFAQGDKLVINAGANRGLNVGDVFSVIRPRGKVESPWTKKGNLGFYVQEVGAVEIVNVKNEVAIARVKTSCDTMLLGDLLMPMPARDSLLYKDRPVIDSFNELSSKTTGRIVMARDGAVMVSRDQIVYVDLGAEDNVQIGDYLTVYRPLGKGNIFDGVKNESISVRESGYQSKKYRNGEFSNQAPRKKGERAGGGLVTSEDAKSRRPNKLRRIVGELVILNVKEKTATAMVVKTTQEVQTGDFVEVQ